MNTEKEYTVTLSTQVASQGQSAEVGAETCDAGTLEGLHNRYSTLVEQVCRRALWAYPSLVDDAVQIVFVIADRKISSLAGMTSHSGWFHRCAVNVCRNLSRRETNRHTYERKADEFRELTTPGVAEDQNRTDVLRHLDDALLELPDRQRETIVRHYLQGNDCRLIGTQIGCSENAVKKLLVRGRETLRQKLTRRGVVVSLAALVAALEHQSAEATELPLAESEEVSEGVRTTADEVIEEMDQAAATAMWWKTGAGAVGLAIIGVGTALVASHFQPRSSAETQPIHAASWRIESVMGSPSVRRGGTTVLPKVGDAVCSGDTVLTSSNQEVQVASDGGSRLLVREEGEVRFEHPTSNTEHRTSKSGEGDSQVRVVCGAIVAKLKRPVYFTTPHAAIQADAGSFFLMVASGLTSNRVPWSFSRLDVTEGNLKLETGNSKLRTDLSTRYENQEPKIENLQPLELRAGMFAAAGTDFEGNIIETVARKSNGRELSPKYGGVFFRDTVEVYKKGLLVLDAYSFEPGRKVKEWRGKELRTDVTNSIGGAAEARLSSDGVVQLVLGQSRGATLVVPLDAPLPENIVIEYNLRYCLRGAGFTGAMGVDTQHADTNKCLMSSVDRPFIPPTHQVQWTPDSVSQWRTAWEFILVVGCSPDGRIVYECRGGGEKNRVASSCGWMQGNGVKYVWFVAEGLDMELRACTVMELNRVGNDSRVGEGERP